MLSWLHSNESWKWQKEVLTHPKKCLPLKSLWWKQILNLLLDCLQSWCMKPTGNNASFNHRGTWFLTQNCMTKLVNHSIRQALCEMTFSHFSYITAWTQKRKISHRLEYSKEWDANSEEFSSKVSEIPWAMRDYLVSEEQVEYRITEKKKLQNEKEIAKKNFKNRLKNGNIFNS